MILICKDTEILLPQTSSRVTPAEKDGCKSEGKKANGNRGVYKLVTFILILHSYRYVNKVEQFVREIDGVESVKAGSNSNKLEVKGKVDPSEIQKRVERKTKTKVKLIFPSPENEGPRENCEEEKTRTDDIASKKIEESVTILKIKLCCDSCNGKLQKKLNVKGLEMMEMDKEKDLVTVKGTMNVTELTSYIKGELKRDVEIMVPAKKDTVSTEKKGRDTGAIGKKDKDAGAMEKKGKEVGTAETILGEKETEPKDKKDAGDMEKKGKEVGAVEIKDKDSQPKGSASVENKSESKDNSVNQKKGKRHRKNKERSSDGSSRENNQEEGIGVATKVNSPYNHSSVDYVYDHSYRDRAHCRPVNYSNGFHDMFSDENPHSCTIL
ncbi:hypothetical protein ACOSP7_029715 [Xanthoceras sorbifolium]